MDIFDYDNHDSLHDSLSLEDKIPEYFHNKAAKQQFGIIHGRHPKSYQKNDELWYYSRLADKRRQRVKYGHPLWDVVKEMSLEHNTTPDPDNHEAFDLLSLDSNLSLNGGSLDKSLHLALDELDSFPSTYKSKTLFKYDSLPTLHSTSSPGNLTKSSSFTSTATTTTNNKPIHHTSAHSLSSPPPVPSSSTGNTPATTTTAVLEDEENNPLNHIDYVKQHSVHYNMTCVIMNEYTAELLCISSTDNEFHIKPITEIDINHDRFRFKIIDIHNPMNSNTILQYGDPFWLQLLDENTGIPVGDTGNPSGNNSNGYHSYNASFFNNNGTAGGGAGGNKGNSSSFLHGYVLCSKVFQSLSMLTNHIPQMPIKLSQDIHHIIPTTTTTTTTTTSTNTTANTTANTTNNTTNSTTNSTNNSTTNSTTNSNSNSNSNDILGHIMMHRMIDVHRVESLPPNYITSNDKASRYLNKHAVHLGKWTAYPAKLHKPSTLLPPNQHHNHNSNVMYSLNPILLQQDQYCLSTALCKEYVSWPLRSQHVIQQSKVISKELMGQVMAHNGGTSGVNSNSNSNSNSNGSNSNDNDNGSSNNSVSSNNSNSNSNNKHHNGHHHHHHHHHNGNSHGSHGHKVHHIHSSSASASSIAAAGTSVINTILQAHQEYSIPIPTTNNNTTNNNTTHHVKFATDDTNTTTTTTNNTVLDKDNLSNPINTTTTAAANIPNTIPTMTPIITTTTTTNTTNTTNTIPSHSQPSHQSHQQSQDQMESDYCCLRRVINTHHTLPSSSFSDRRSVWKLCLCDDDQFEDDMEATDSSNPINNSTQSKRYKDSKRVIDRALKSLKVSKLYREGCLQVYEGSGGSEDNSDEGEESNNHKKKEHKGIDENENDDGDENDSIPSDDDNEEERANEVTTATGKRMTTAKLTIKQHHPTQLQQQQQQQQQQQALQNSTMSVQSDLTSIGASFHTAGSAYSFGTSAAGSATASVSSYSNAALPPLAGGTKFARLLRERTFVTQQELNTQYLTTRRQQELHVEDYFQHQIEQFLIKTNPNISENNTHKKKKKQHVVAASTSASLTATTATTSSIGSSKKLSKQQQEVVEYNAEGERLIYPTEDDDLYSSIKHYHNPNDNVEQQQEKPQDWQFLTDALDQVTNNTKNSIIPSSFDIVGSPTAATATATTVASKITRKPNTLTTATTGVGVGTVAGAASAAATTTNSNSNNIGSILKKTPTMKVASFGNNNNTANTNKSSNNTMLDKALIQRTLLTNASAVAEFDELSQGEQVLAYHRTMKYFAKMAEQQIVTQKQLAKEKEALLLQTAFSSSPPPLTMNNNSSNSNNSSILSSAHHLHDINNNINNTTKHRSASFLLQQQQQQYSSSPLHYSSNNNGSFSSLNGNGNGLTSRRNSAHIGNNLNSSFATTNTNTSIHSIHNSNNSPLTSAHHHQRKQSANSYHSISNNNNVTSGSAKYGHRDNNSSSNSNSNSNQHHNHKEENAAASLYAAAAIRQKNAPILSSSILSKIEKLQSQDSYVSHILDMKEQMSKQGESYYEDHNGY